MDYLFASSVAGVGLRMLTISYNIGCQWFVNFWKRLPLIPPELHLPRWLLV